MPSSDAGTFYAYEQRRVGAALAIAIFVAPPLFAWLLLRSGYSALARIVSFGWLALVIVSIAAGAMAPSIGAKPSLPSVPPTNEKRAEAAQAPAPMTVNSGTGNEQDNAEAYTAAKSAIDSVRYSLADPDSALFKDVWAVRGQIADAPETVFACGTVNAKNAYGGYVGYTPFVAVGSTVLTPQDSIFERVFRQVCLDGKKLFPIQA